MARFFLQLAQPIKLLLNYVEDFDEIHFVMGDGPDFSKEEWESKRNTFGLELSNSNSEAIREAYKDVVSFRSTLMETSLAIIKYIGRKHNLDRMQSCTRMFGGVYTVLGETTRNPTDTMVKPLDSGLKRAVAVVESWLNLSDCYNYVDEDFDEIHFVMGDGPDFSKEEWESKKNTFGLEFPNLPFYIDGDIKITQTLAIIKFIGRKHNLVGENNGDQAMVDMMLSYYMDMLTAVGTVGYDPDYEKLKDDMFSAVKNKYLTQIEQHLKDGSTWMVGDSVTVADFPMYEVLDETRGNNPDILQGFPNFIDYMARFEDLPAIKKYMVSGNYMRTPIFNKIAGYYKTHVFNVTFT